MKNAMVAISVALAGCMHNPAVVPVATPCLKSVPDRPAYQFGKGAMPSPAEAVKLLAKDLEAAQTYGDAWEAAASGCAALMQAGK